VKHFCGGDLLLGVSAKEYNIKGGGEIMSAKVVIEVLERASRESQFISQLSKQRLRVLDT